MQKPAMQIANQLTLMKRTLTIDKEDVKSVMSKPYVNDKVSMSETADRYPYWRPSFKSKKRYRIWIHKSDRGKDHERARQSAGQIKKARKKKERQTDRQADRQTDRETEIEEQKQRNRDREGRNSR